MLIEERSLTMSATAGILKQVLEKTVAGVVIRRNAGADLRDQLFVVFTDNTYVEFSDDVSRSNRLEVGSLETVKQYAAQLGGNAEVIT
jgi:hypothetical protein